MKTAKIITGKRVLDIITCGMYTEPLMVYREYIQNSTDAIDEALALGLLISESAKIGMHIDGRQRCVEIVDNGKGMTRSEALSSLCAIGISSKDHQRQRGFRGIGRLGGLAYCDRLIFETKSADSALATIVTWDAKRLRALLADESVQNDIDGVVSECVSVGTKRPHEAERHYFRVIMEGVKKFHRDELMDVTAVRDYLSQHAPVPHDSNIFRFAEKAKQHVEVVQGYGTYVILVNGKSLFRPHRHIVELTANRSDEISGLRLFSVLGGDDSEIGRGWYAETALLAGMPPRVRMRGVRVFQGNIMVGDEKFLMGNYSESRFATWHIGEIHLSYAVKTNARRDGFEQSRDYEAVLEQFSHLGAVLSVQCREASNERSGQIRARRAEEGLEIVRNVSFAVDELHRKQLEAVCIALDGRIKTNGSGRRSVKNELERISQLGLFRDRLDGRRMNGKHRKDLMVDLARRILDEWGNEPETISRLEAIYSPYLKDI